MYECAIISHYHNGTTYEGAFELTPFEKQVIGEFIEQDQEREMNIRKATFGIGRV